MDNTSISQYTREKAESDLYSSYEKALSHLESGDLASGEAILSSLLSSPLLQSLNDVEFKYGILLSLAHTKEAANSIDEALSLYYKANKLRNNSDAGLWLKLALLCEKQGYFAQADQCFQESLRNSKDIAFERVLYEKMIQMGFLANDWENTLKRLEFLKRSEVVSDEMIAIKCYIYLKKSAYESYEFAFREALQRNPLFNIENFAIIQRIKELEKLEHQQKIRAKEEKNDIKTKEAEFVISLEKNSWKSCFEVLSFILKVFQLKIKGTPIKAKYRKSKLRGYIEQISNLSLAETAVVFREKKDIVKNSLKKSKLSKNPDEMVLEKPLEKTVNFMENPIDKTYDDLHDKTNENLENIKETTEIPNKINEKTEKPQDFLENIENPLQKSNEIQQNLNEKPSDSNEMVIEIEKPLIEYGNSTELRGKSKRIQSIKASEINIDEFLHTISMKKSQDLSKKLLNFRENGLKDMSQEIINQYNTIFKHFLPNPQSSIIIEENSFQIEEIKTFLQETKFIEERSLKRTSNNDFLSFLTSHKSKKFTSFLHLFQEILTHFFKNKCNRYSSQIHPPEFFKKLKEICSESMNFTPHPLLITPELRSSLLRLLFRLFTFYRPLFNDLETSLTLFELAFDHYLDRKARIKPQNDSIKTEKKLLIIKTILQEISIRFLYEDFSNDITSENRILLRIRAFHILTVFYSYKDFTAVHMAKSSLNFLRKSLWEFLGQDPRSFSENIDFLNLFWLNCRVINNGFFELIEERIMEAKDPFAKMEDNVRQKKLMKYLELFQERVLLSFEDALDLYYRQILEFCIKPGLDNKTFLRSLKEILKIFHKFLAFRKTSAEDMRKLIIKTQESMKIEVLMCSFMEFYKEKTLLFEENNDLNEFYFLIVKTLMLMIGLHSQENLKETGILQTLGTVNAYILGFFIKKPDFLISGFNFLHFLIDLIPENTQNLHKIVFPLEFRKNVINLLLEQAETLAVSNQEDHVFEEISQYFLCFYGINSPKKIDDLVEKTPESLITEIEEIGFFMKYLEIFHEDHFSLNSPKFKPTIQNFLITSFEFLKHHDDKWILCTQLERLINENLKEYLETGETSVLTELFSLRNPSQTNSNCFCEKSCFPTSREMSCFYQKGFFLMGKAFLEQGAQEIENLKTRKSNLKKAEKMFQLHVCLNPWDEQSWLFLGRLYRDMGYVYSDQAIYSVIQHKIEEFQGANSKVERIMGDILKRIEEGMDIGALEKKSDKIDPELEEKYEKLRGIRTEARDTLIVLNILEMMQGKFRWVKGEISWKDYNEIQEKKFSKISKISLQEENIRGLFFRELYVNRKNLSKFSSEFNLFHIRNLGLIKGIIEKFLIQDDEDFKDESCLIELEVELWISLWKILKRYTKLLKFVEFLGFDRLQSRMNEEFSKFNLMCIADVIVLIQRDCTVFLSSLKDLDKTLDLNEFIEIEKDLSLLDSSSLDDLSINLMLNTGEVIQAGCEKESEKLFQLLKGLLLAPNIEDSLNKKPSFHLNRWLNKGFEVLLMRMSKAVNKYSKKYRYYKLYVLACYYAAKINVLLKRPEEDYQANMMQYPAGGPLQCINDGQRYMKAFDELFSIKTFELVEIYKKERDPVFCSLFHRDLMFLFLKLKLIKMKSSLSIEKIGDIDKLRLLNNKISRIVIKNIEGVDILNEVLILGYSITLKDLSIGIKSLFLNEKESSNNNEVNLQKWIDDLIFTVVKQKTVNKFLKEKQPELLRRFEEMLRISYRFYQNKEKGLNMTLIDSNQGDIEEITNNALSYFLTLHYKKRNKSKKGIFDDNNMTEQQEINIID